jgi:hypothetical protein
MKVYNCFLLYLLLIVLFAACSNPQIKNYSESSEKPGIFPDYTDVTIPCNIAPLNFRLNSFEDKCLVEVKGAKSNLRIASDDGKIEFPQKKWGRFLHDNKGDSIQLIVFNRTGNSWTKYKPFSIFISTDSIDSHLAYRLIEPGYELWNEMGIYQRNLENFDETAIYENKNNEYNCVNCHSFCMQNPNEMLFHTRAKNGGTMVLKDGEIEKLTTKTEQTISNLVYPYWHPDGRFVAFSVNNTKQVFYLHNSNRIEVYDTKSDVVVYDTQEHEIFTSPLLSDKNRFETFPGFSPDSKTLYFCSAKPYDVPAKSDSVKYSLCAIQFDAATQTFGAIVDTIFNANTMDRSVAFPRVSPNGEYLLFTVADYGCFPIWHKEADLYLYNLETKKYAEMREVNSPDVESYHSWSSNSKWFVFSSRRGDGLYTRPFFAHVGKNGETGKAFMLPQKNPDFYDAFMKSYNIPELITGKVGIDAYSISKESKTEGTQVKFKMQ